MARSKKIIIPQCWSCSPTILLTDGHHACSKHDMHIVYACRANSKGKTIEKPTVTV